MRRQEAYPFLDVPVTLLDLLSPPPPSPPLLMTFLVGQEIFSQVYFEEITLCFTLMC